MRLLLSTALLVAFTLSAPISEEKIEIEGVGQVGLTKVLNFFWPNSPEVQLFSVVIDAPDEEANKYDEIVLRHKDFKDFNELLDDLKKVDSASYDKIKPLYDQNFAAYSSLTGEAKTFMKRYLKDIWANLRIAAGEEDEEGDDKSKGKFISREQGAALRSKFEALTAEQKESIKSRFPMLTYFLVRKIFEKSH